MMASSDQGMQNVLRAMLWWMAIFCPVLLSRREVSYIENTTSHVVANLGEKNSCLTLVHVVHGKPYASQPMTEDESSVQVEMHLQPVWSD